MENASKALIIAGGVLIAILLLTLFTYLFSKMANGTSKIYDMMEQSEIAEFNQKFLNYKGRNDLKIQDVVTIINLAKDGTEGPNAKASVKVYLGSSEITDNVIKDMLSDKENVKHTYTCNKIDGVIVDKNTLLVREVHITQNH